MPLLPYTVNAIIAPPVSDTPGAADAMPATFGKSLTSRQIADLAAFVDAPQT